MTDLSHDPHKKDRSDEFSSSGLFAGEKDWLPFLSGLASLGKLGVSAPIGNSFVSRNFALDEGPQASRVESYRELGALASHADFAAWEKAHNLYLEERIFLATDDDGLPKRLDPDDPEELPETFRDVDSSPFTSSDEKLQLIRVEEVGFLASKTGKAAAEICARATRFLDKKASREEESELGALLLNWHQQIDQRPLYAGFGEDLDDLFKEPSPPDWADQLRDRLGLAHLDPGSRGPIDVLVFRYSVKDIPSFKGPRGLRPILPPSVLDSKFSWAFCPSPRGLPTGHVLHLSGDTPIRREVLHPRPAFRLQNLLRVGRIVKPVRLDDLRMLRGLHLVEIRNTSGRDDYAQGTDWDLFV